MINEGLSKQTTSLSSSNILGMSDVYMLMVVGIFSIPIFEVLFYQMFHIMENTVRINIDDGIYSSKVKSLHCTEWNRVWFNIST